MSMNTNYEATLVKERISVDAALKKKENMLLSGYEVVLLQ